MVCLLGNFVRSVIFWEPWSNPYFRLPYLFVRVYVDSYSQLDIQVSNSIFCLQHKKNNNQIVWLLQKVKRQETTHGFVTFREFLDNQQYSKTGVLRYEKIFGRTFISTGGFDTTKVQYNSKMCMFSKWCHRLKQYNYW